MLDQELRALVSVEPSPEFEARVRTTIAQQPARTTWFRWWQPAALAAVSLLILSIGLLTERQSVTPNDPATTTAALDRLLPDVPLPSSSLTAHASTLRDTVHPVRIPTSRVSELRHAVPPRLDVQIDRAEAEALQRLFNAPPWIAVDVASGPTSAGDALQIPGLSIAPVAIPATFAGDSK
jgi:hypothetical protein